MNVMCVQKSLKISKQLYGKAEICGGVKEKLRFIHMDIQLQFEIIIVCHTAERKKKRKNEKRRKKIIVAFFLRFSFPLFVFVFKAFNFLMMLPAHFSFCHSSIVFTQTCHRLQSICSINCANTFMHSNNNKKKKKRKKVDGYVIFFKDRKRYRSFSHCCHKDFSCVFCFSISFSNFTLGQLTIAWL